MDKRKFVLFLSGQDSTLRSFSTVHDRHSKNLGRASYNKKKSRKAGLKKDQHCMPPVTRVASGRLSLVYCMVKSKVIHGIKTL